MRYPNTIEGNFIDRPNRFIAHVQIGETIHTVHVKNTGRCKELLLPGARVILQDSWGVSCGGADGVGASGMGANDGSVSCGGAQDASASGGGAPRKTRYDLIAVWKANLGWVNIDSQAPNKVVREWLESDNTIFGRLDRIKSEYVYGDSRVDFYLEKAERKILMEVKGCTLEIDGEGYFPDAPTERGVKHLHELEGAIVQGYECYIVFVIAMKGVESVHPNISTHPEFGEALNRATAAGVKELFLCCNVKSDELVVDKVNIGGRNSQ